MTLWETITAAVRDLSEHGYDSVERVAKWLELLRQAAEVEMTPPHELEALLRKHLGDVYRAQVEGGQLYRLHPAVERYKVDRLRPEMRAELDRRLVASRSLIRNNRAQAIELMARRFEGWATSVPKGGSDAVDKLAEKVDLRKSVASLPFAERRVLIDQAHKFTAALSETVALGNNALAGVWHSHWRQKGYNYRPDHRDRDERTYAVRGSWAMERGLMTKGAGYVDEMTRVGEEPFCRCSMQWLYALRDLPRDMLTNKGSEALASSKVA
jgi:hypothetical protein